MTALRLGADTIAHLIPHRRPFLFVDGIEGFARSPQPTLTAFKAVSSNEPVFEGHFPGLSLWPGVYTIEGLGQSANALIVILGLIEAAERRGHSESDALDVLRAIDARAKLGHRRVTDVEREVLSALGEPRSRVGLAGAIEVKLIEPVFAGEIISYRVSLSRVIANARRFDVEASVRDRPVARGTMTSAVPQGG